MTEEVKMVVHDMECIVKKTFNRVKTPLMSDHELPLSEVNIMIDIAKDCASMMKDVTKIKHFYAQHSEVTI